MPDRLRHRRPLLPAWASDDTGSLALAMLLAMVGVTLTALMSPMLMTQITSTRSDIQKTHALHAAEAGLNVGVGQIRASNGSISALPCGPLTGSVTTGGTARYRVSIDYLKANPNGNVSSAYLTSAASSDSWITANSISCTSGSGTGSTPAYALLRALGTDQASGSITSVPNRALWATYTFATTDAKPAGAAIRPSQHSDLCINGTTTKISMEACTGAAAQIWTYTTDLTLQLKNTNLCLDAGATHVLTLQTCDSPVPPRQQWIYNSAANFAATSDGDAPDGYCLNVTSPGDIGSNLTLGTACGDRYDDKQSFRPDPTVGAGAAPASVNGQTQLVNYDQFSDCIDIPRAAPLQYHYLQAWTCKQTLDGSAVLWNQMWTMPTPSGSATTASGNISTTCNNNPEKVGKCTNGKLFCLQSPLSSAAGLYVQAVDCSSTTTGLTWTRYGGSDQLTPAQRYQITDSGGLCLTASTDPADLTTDSLSKIVVRLCDGTAAQKWNRPAINEPGAPLHDVGER